ncbi:MAG: STAS domain-containing protein [Desulfarculaceae bacterium]|nr:STAS domain-containing protein [Desulfarculaceae bacterium]MCF8071597.1 STAS domain-containing protein [Desulfarculaceae bacterium]MCF8103206.1 STAS domain-containing protein [Desulfarculaceae bacterium]MCF8114876.1 STAS domain-containing protein [Desulfarculaceae bacterium]
MDLDYKLVGDVLVVAPRHERLDASMAGSLKQKLREFVDKGHHKLVLDLDTVHFMDSSGLTVIISTLKALDGRHGELVVCGVDENLASLFHLTRLDKVFRVFPDQAQASQALRA